MKEKIILFLAVIILTASVSGCTNTNIQEKAEQAVSNVLEDVGDKMREKRIEKEDFTNLSSKDMVYYIEEVLNSKDADKLCDLFSEKAKSEVGEEELRAQIEGLLDIIGSEEVSLNFDGASEGTESDYGVKNGHKTLEFTFFADGTEYDCLVYMISHSSESNENVGVRFMQFITTDLLDSDDFQLDDFDIPGITIYR